MAHEHHAIDYIEINVTDLAAAKKFYTGAFGWKFNDYGPDYAGIQGKDRELGGLRQDTVTRGGPLIVIYSKDIEASIDNVRSAGGRVVRATFSFPGGRRFQFLDPAGNELAVWSEK